MKQFMLITFTGTKCIINETEFDRILKADRNGNFLTNGLVIKITNIAEIVELDKYYQANPDERPEKKNEFKSIEYKKTYTKNQYLNALKEMIKGFVKHFEGRQMPINSKKIYDRMMNRYNWVKNSTEDNFNCPYQDVKSSL